MMRLNSYHATLLEAMCREVEIHLSWERLTLELPRESVLAAVEAVGTKVG